MYKNERMQILRWSKLCTSFFIQMIDYEIKFKNFFFLGLTMKNCIFTFFYKKRSGVYAEMKIFFASLAYEILYNKVLF